MTLVIYYNLTAYMFRLNDKMYNDSYCDCDSGWGNLFVDLKKEKVLLGPKGERKTTVHFIKSFKEYEKEWEKMMNIHNKKRKKELKKKGYDNLIALDYGENKKKKEK